MTPHIIPVDAIAAFVVAFGSTLLLTPLVRIWALRHRIGDKPNGRRVHVRMIPHVGGLAMVTGVAAAVAAAMAAGGSVTLSGVMPLAAPIALIVALGVVDDLKSLRAMQKLAVQLMVAALLVGAGHRLVTGLGGVDAVAWASLGVAMAFFVGMSSAVNLVDGHDGLAAGISAISGGALAALAASWGAALPGVLALCVVGVSLGFLVYNMPPGRIYMGDTGSMFLGTLLAVVACALSATRPGGSTFAALCLILSVPMLDVFLAIARRSILRLPVFRADALHMHHVLARLGFTARQVLAILYGMQTVLAALGVVAAQGFKFPIVVGGVFLAGSFAVFLRLMVALHRADALELDAVDGAAVAEPRRAWR